MATDFPGLAPWRSIWFDRWVGLYGWLDTPMPAWLENVALVFAAGLLALAAYGVLGSWPLRRPARNRRLLELSVYLLVAIGLLVMIGSASYLEFPTQAGRYGEPRYMLPLIAVGAAVLVLSVRGVGQLGTWLSSRGVPGASWRWGPVAGALIVVALLNWDVFSQLQTISRFYG
jgi:hypothetical protein